MIICGMDEAGRGALAGPLIAAAAILDYHSPIPGLNDSKKLSRIRREKLYLQITESAIRVETEIISARQINSRGIGWANKEIFRKLVKKIEADKYIIDGNLQVKVKGFSKRIKSVIKADNSRKCVMAASIIAKVTRDRLMTELARQHPDYGWEKNAGYGTRYHVEAIKELGIVRYHRTVYVTTAMKKLFYATS